MAVIRENQGYVNFVAVETNDFGLDISGRVEWDADEPVLDLRIAKLIKKLKYPDSVNFDAALENVEFLAEVAAGAFGEVLKVKHPHLGEVALKLVRSNNATAITHARVPGEGLGLCFSEFPGFVKTHSLLLYDPKTRKVEVYEAGNPEHMMMHRAGYKIVGLFAEFAEGAELYSLVGVKNPPELIQTYMKQMLHAMAPFHKAGFLHRDLKPDNMIINGNLLKILDYGLSKLPELPNMMHTVVGTMYYIAPEVLGKRAYGSAADIWSIGVIIGVISLNTTLFADAPQIANYAQNPEKFPEFSDYAMTRNLGFQKLDKDLQDLLNKMLARDPDDRPSADEALKHPYFANGIKVII